MRLGQILQWPSKWSFQTRRWVGLCVLFLGFIVVGRVIWPSVPRDVTLKVSLGSFRTAPSTARSLSLTLSRNGEAVQMVTEHFSRGVVPREWSRTLSLPPGHYQSIVSVELDYGVRERRENVDLQAGSTVLIAAPLP